MSRDEWLAEPLPRDVRAALDRIERAPDVRRVVALPDVHLAKEVCVGTAVATSASLYPAAVGGDIGCGMAALAFDVEAACLEGSAERVLDELRERVPILGRPDAAPLPAALAERPLSDATLENAKRRDAAAQLGSLGRGNHFVELQADETGRLWTMVHSGSRAMGQTIRAFHERRGERVAGGLRRLDAASPEGAAYLADVEWALDYAAENRRRLLLAVEAALASLLGARADPSTAIHCHHNFVRREEHGGERLWVHRKGAISARDGEPGVIPGSMGTPSFHVEGRGEPRALCTSSHGAGRRLARGAARRAISRRDVERQLSGVAYDRNLTARLRDEAPAAYKDIGRVMRAQRGLTRVVRRLVPVLSYTAA